MDPAERTGFPFGYLVVINLVKGFWSILMQSLLAIKRVVHFPNAKTIAKHSFLVVEYVLSAFVSNRSLRAVVTTRCPPLLFLYTVALGCSRRKSVIGKRNGRVGIWLTSSYPGEGLR